MENWSNLVFASMHFNEILRKYSVIYDILITRYYCSHGNNSQWIEDSNYEKNSRPIEFQGKNFRKRAIITLGMFEEKLFIDFIETWIVF